MQIFVEKIENPSQEFWIWKKEITNRQTEDIYPSAISNVGSGISAAIYQKDEAGHVTQIAQLQLPDYEKLVEYYSAGKEINLNYTYIDDFAWLGDELPYEVESLPYPCVIKGSGTHYSELLREEFEDLRGGDPLCRSQENTDRGQRRLSALPAVYRFVFRRAWLTSAAGRKLRVNILKCLRHSTLCVLFIGHIARYCDLCT